MTCLAILLRFSMSLAAWHGDLSDTPESRAELYRPVVESACRVGRNDTERAWLLAQAYAETRLARAVLMFECHKLGPLWCDRQLAAGPWQNRLSARTVVVFDRYASLADRYDSGARAALYLARTCRTPEGWFAAQGGRRKCTARWARARVPLFYRALEALRRGSL